MSEARLRDLIAFLRHEGAATAPGIAAAFGISQPTVSRLLSAAGDQVLRIGKARATRYALSRTLDRAGRRWPLFRLRPDGRAETLGDLHAMHGDGFLFVPQNARPVLVHGEFADGVFPGLPWFLDDQRPQGFLGRAFARRVAEDICAPQDLQRWQPDDVVLSLLRHGDDQPGDLVLGEFALQRAQQAALQPADALKKAQRSRHYPQRADAVLRGEAVGSSAGGEQPKFTAILHTEGGYTAVIVKFSERAGTPAAQRWSDLLRCEHLASDILRAHGIAAVESELLESDGRVFLQSTRFDRTPVLGRRGFVSLAAVDAAYFGHGRIDWWSFAPQLQREGWLSDADAQRLRVCGWFGALIGNNDMHLGNAGLMLGDVLPLALAPVYDMLPMAFRPAASGEVVERAYVLPLPTPDQRDDWRAAAGMAVPFWERVIEDVHVSAAFHSIARDGLAQLTRALPRIG
ncbi:type II toxin-antitoxin system HipA family toxin YjjJ [Xanthomonas sacchari]|uniref:type II toxin-antitoxin system HipA family toxin YjjJ n=1 Tax=Xanthomonas sp. SHU 308 TaxID=1591201 RepID=UPI000369B195|nr:type II toxin-antitoxin system HipA family toxin YjjJ [Xanthomonas sp. SHU 308]